MQQMLQAALQYLLAAMCYVLIVSECALSDDQILHIDGKPFRPFPKVSGHHAILDRYLIGLAGVISTLWVCRSCKICASVRIRWIRLAPLVLLTTALAWFLWLLQLSASQAAFAWSRYTLRRQLPPGVEVVTIEASSCSYGRPMSTDETLINWCPPPPRTSKHPGTAVLMNKRNRKSLLWQPDARLFHAVDVHQADLSGRHHCCHWLGGSSAVNILYTEEGPLWRPFVFDKSGTGRFHLLVGYDPRPLPGYISKNWGFGMLASRLRIPVSPPSNRYSARARGSNSSGGTGGLVVWAARNCGSHSRRLEYLQALAREGVPVHSIGKC
jgi:hypothetical protein